MNDWGSFRAALGEAKRGMGDAQVAIQFASTGSTSTIAQRVMRNTSEEHLETIKEAVDKLCSSFVSEQEAAVRELLKHAKKAKHLDAVVHHFLGNRKAAITLAEMCLTPSADSNGNMVDKLGYLACWLLTNIVSSSHTKCFMREIIILDSIVMPENSERYANKHVAQAFWAISNFTADKDPECHSRYYNNFFFDCVEYYIHQKDFFSEKELATQPLYAMDALLHFANKQPVDHELKDRQFALLQHLLKNLPKLYPVLKETPWLIYRLMRSGDSLEETFADKFGDVVALLVKGLHTSLEEFGLSVSHAFFLGLGSVMMGPSSVEDLVLSTSFLEAEFISFISSCLLKEQFVSDCYWVAGNVLGMNNGSEQLENPAFALLINYIASNRIPIKNLKLIRVASLFMTDLLFHTLNFPEFYFDFGIIAALEFLKKNSHEAQFLDAYAEHRPKLPGAAMEQMEQPEEIMEEMPTLNELDDRFTNLSGLLENKDLAAVFDLLKV
ncbi:hypothetical protein PCE1_002605 [Barthelona sp. PCE]